MSEGPAVARGGGRAYKRNHTIPCKSSVAMDGIKLDVARFWRNGYQHIRGVFSAAEVAGMRERAHEAIARRGRDGREIDLFAEPSVRGILLDQRILGIAEALLGEIPIYFGESNFGFFTGVKRVGTYHKDNVDRLDPSGPDWKGRYNILKLAIYLQDHRRRAGGLTVLGKSHLRVRKNRIAEVLTEEVVSSLLGRAHYLQTAPGDVIAWTLNTTHAGFGNALRLAPFLAVTERNQRFVPRFLTYPFVPEHGAFFLSFAGEGAHFERYLAHEKTRATQVKRWAANPYDDGARAAAAGKRIRVRDMNREISEDLAKGKSLGQRQKWSATPG